MRRIILAAAVAAASLAAVAVPAAASSGSERAPECVTIRAANTDGTAIWLELCGSGPGRESPLHDWAQGRTLTVDGAYLRGQGCGHQADACVMFAIRSPQS